MTDIYETIEKRTGGDIYIGVVGPVRSGKSTFIKQFMECLVIPNISDADKRTTVGRRTYCYDHPTKLYTTATGTYNHRIQTEFESSTG